MGEELCQPIPKDRIWASGDPTEGILGGRNHKK